MPIFWRYIIQHYTRVFFFSVFLFLTLLLVARFKEIARFAALSGQWREVGLFTVYQLPLILPLAIPLSALFSSFLLFQRLSRAKELLALSTSGGSYSQLFAPLLLTSTLFTLLHLLLLNELSPASRRATRRLLYEESSQSPLLLLQKKELLKWHNFFAQMEGEGEQVSRLLLLVPSSTTDRLALLTVDHLSVEQGGELQGTGASLLSYLPPSPNDGFAPLLLEHHRTATTPPISLASTLKKNRPRLDPSDLNFKMLSFRLQESPEQARSAAVELLRRFTLSLAVLTFTLLGATFAIEPGRLPSKKGWTLASLLTLLTLTSYLLGKGLKQNLSLATLILLAPHLLITLASLQRLRHLSRGGCS